jgi:ribosome biogenesis GTPase A
LNKEGMLLRWNAARVHSVRRFAVALRPACTPRPFSVAAAFPVRPLSLEVDSTRKAAVAPEELEVERLFGGGGQCSGCGAPLQSERPDEPGYRPAQPLQRERAGRAGVCRRCHRLSAYGEAVPLRVPYSQLAAQLAHLRTQRCVVVAVVDLFDASGTLLPRLRHDVAGSNPVVLVGNKVDTLPRGAKRERVRVWLKHAAERAGLRGIEGVFLTSGVSGEGVGALLRRLELMHNGRNVYVVGCTSVGKSTLVNALIKRALGSSGAHRELTTSPLHGTTLALVSFPLRGRKVERADGSSDVKDARLFDSPGVIHPGQLAHLLDPAEFRSVAVSRRIRPRFLRLVPGKSVLLAGLTRVDFVGGADSVALGLFLSPTLQVHARATEGCDEFVLARRGSFLTPPATPERAAEMPLDGRTALRVDVGRRGWEVSAADIVVPGVGWISVNGPADTALQFVVQHPRAAAVSTREPLMPFEYGEKRKALGVTKHGRVDTRHRLGDRAQQRRAE